MGLDELRQQMLRVLRKVRKQFNRLAWQEGLSDSEFLDEFVLPLETKIKQDIAVEKMRRPSSK